MAPTVVEEEGVVVGCHGDDRGREEEWVEEWVALGAEFDRKEMRQ